MNDQTVDLETRSVPASVDSRRRAASGPPMTRTLGSAQLVLLGVGCIIGAGVYVMTGSVAATYAGPAVVLSFGLAAFACVFAALSYAALARRMPVSGSAYSYARALFGEGLAWTVGWLLLLEYGASVAGVSAGWSASVASLLGDLHLTLPSAVSQATLSAKPGIHGLTVGIQPTVNLVAGAAVLALAGWLRLGLRGAVALNAVAVALKVGVLLLFLAVGVFFVHPSNWAPFIPPSEGGSRFGLGGVVRGASAIFFSYIGFEAVSTAAGEARAPARSVPIGILGSLAVCAGLYMATAAVLTGIVPFRELNTAAPIALAATRIGMPWFSILIKVGSIAGLTSVMLVLMFGQSRVLMAMAVDGMAPALFGRIDPRTGTPAQGILVLGVLLAIVAATLPIGLIGDLVSLGTATAFAMVCVCLCKLRSAEAPVGRRWAGLLIPALGVLASAAMALPVLFDLVERAFKSDAIPVALLCAYGGTGACLFAWRRRRGRKFRAKSDTASRLDA